MNLGFACSSLMVTAQKASAFLVLEPCLSEVVRKSMFMQHKKIVQTCEKLQHFNPALNNMEAIEVLLKVKGDNVI